MPKSSTSYSIETSAVGHESKRRAKEARKLHALKAVAGKRIKEAAEEIFGDDFVENVAPSTSSAVDQSIEEQTPSTSTASRKVLECIEDTDETASSTSSIESNQQIEDFDEMDVITLDALENSQKLLNLLPSSAILSTNTESIQSEFMLSDEQKNLIKKGFHFCPYCSSIIKKLDYRHFNTISCNRNNFYASNGWSLIFNSCLDNKLTDTTTLTKFLNSQIGTSILYVVRKGPLLSDFLYVGVCRSLRKRVGRHKQKKFFAEFEQLEVGVLFSKMSKQCAEFLESLLILSGLVPGGELKNTRYEYNNLQTFIGCKTNEFHQKVASFHHEAVSLLSNNWKRIEWSLFKPTCEKKILFSKEVIQILNDYYLQHISDPYPSNDVKCELARKTGLSVQQVSGWFKSRKSTTTYKKKLPTQEEKNE